MKSRRELKALLLAGVATLSLMSGCSKNNSKPDYGYYVEIEGELIEIENVTFFRAYNSGRVELVFEDGSHMIIPTADLYKIDKNSELQKEVLCKLTK